jgi:hypothetical protein
MLRLPFLCYRWEDSGEKGGGYNSHLTSIRTNLIKYLPFMTRFHPLQITSNQIKSCISFPSDHDLVSKSKSISIFCFLPCGSISITGLVWSVAQGAKQIGEAQRKTRGRNRWERLEVEFLVGVSSRLDIFLIYWKIKYFFLGRCHLCGSFFDPDTGHLQLIAYDFALREAAKEDIWDKTNTTF